MRYDAYQSLDQGKCAHRRPLSHGEGMDSTATMVSLRLGSRVERGSITDAVGLHGCVCWEEEEIPSLRRLCLTHQRRLGDEHVQFGAGRGKLRFLGRKSTRGVLANMKNFGKLSTGVCRAAKVHPLLIIDGRDAVKRNSAHLEVPRILEMI